MGKSVKLKFLPIQALRGLHGKTLGELNRDERRLVEKALSRPIFGRDYNISLWRGRIEVETLKRSMELFIKRRESGMVRAEGSYWPLHERDSD